MSGDIAGLEANLAESPARRLRVLAVLGQGGFGAVYLVEVHGGGLVQRLALKVMNTEMNQIGDMVARQRDEARLLARLNHDCIVKVFELTEIGGRPAVLMEYVEGCDVRALITGGAMPARVSFELISSVAGALDAAYSTPDPISGLPLEVVHRDIKPANILLSRHGGVKVLDFGIARSNFDREGRTGSAQFGTPRYMAPEQWLTGRVGPEIDVLALGRCLIELLSGRRAPRAPLDRMAYDQHVDGLLRTIPLISPDIDAELLVLLREMLAFDHAVRPDAARVHEVTAVLAERATGEGLRRFARRVVTEKLAEREARALMSSLPDLGTLPVLASLAPQAAPVAATVSVPGPPTPPTPTTAQEHQTLTPPTVTIERPVVQRGAGLAAGVLAASGVVLGGLGVVAVLALWAGAEPEVGPAETTSIASSPGPSPQAETERMEAPAQPQPAQPQPARPQSEQPPTTQSETAVTERGSAGAAQSREGRSRQLSSEPNETDDPSSSAAPSARVTPRQTSAEPVETASTPDVAEPDPTPRTVKTPPVRVSFSSKPANATVTVDGRAMGQTPLQGLSLTPGDHAIVMEVAGWSYSGTVNVLAGRSSAYRWDAADARFYRRER